MNAVEQLARLLPPSVATEKLEQYSIQIEQSDLPPTVQGSEKRKAQTLQISELSGALAGLTQEQEQLIWCKYLIDPASCRKGMIAYRNFLYKDKELLDWVFAREHIGAEQRLSDQVQNLIDLRTSVSAVLSSTAYEDIVGSHVCLTCKGVGGFEVKGGTIKCEECKGKGHLGNRSTAQLRADKLHISLSGYYRKYHKPFERLYWQPLIKIETQAIMHITERWG